MSDSRRNRAPRRRPPTKEGIVNGKRIGIFIGLAVMATAVGLAMATAGTGQNPTTSGGRGEAFDRSFARLPRARVAYGPRDPQ